MTDEEYVFRQTERERKRDGRGTFNKKRQGGKTVRFPSDYMTKKEREQMNGAVKTWKEQEFYTYEEWKALPEDVQIRHLNSVLNRFACGLSAIAEVEFGARPDTVDKYVRARNMLEWLNIPKRGGSYVEKRKAREQLAVAVEAYRHPTEPVEVTAEVNDPVVPVADPPKPVEDIQIAPKAALDVSNIALLLQTLVGSGAELTIKINL